MASEALALRATNDLTETMDPSEGAVIVTVGAVVSPEMPPVGVGDGTGVGADVQEKLPFEEGPMPALLAPWTQNT
jgi:hypothetical protein